MNLVAIIDSADQALAIDSCAAIKTWVTDKIVLTSDGNYKNMANGLLTALQWNADWYIYLKHNAVFNNNQFLSDLEDASDRGIWCLGNLTNSPLEQPNIALPDLEKILQQKIEYSWRFVDCCMFFHRNFLEAMKKKGIFDLIFDSAISLEDGWFYPTLASVLGGKVEWLAWFDEKCHYWGGKFYVYLMRSQPPLQPTECFLEASIFSCNGWDYARGLAATRRQLCTITTL